MDSNEPKDPFVRAMLSIADTSHKSDKALLGAIEVLAQTILQFNHKMADLEKRIQDLTDLYIRLSSQK